MKLAKETADAMAGICDLLYALSAAVPDLAPALRNGARVIFDAAEGAFIVSARLEDGTSQPLLAISCDPSDREAFGSVGAPMAMPPTSMTTWH
jgi:hypothetical protein